MRNRLILTNIIQIIDGESPTRPLPTLNNLSGEVFIANSDFGCLIGLEPVRSALFPVLVIHRHFVNKWSEDYLLRNIAQVRPAKTYNLRPIFSYPQATAI